MSRHEGGYCYKVKNGLTWALKVNMRSGKDILPVGAHIVGLIYAGKVGKVSRTVNFMVKLLGIGQLQLVLHGGIVANTCRRETNTHE